MISKQLMISITKHDESNWSLRSQNIRCFNTQDEESTIRRCTNSVINRPPLQAIVDPEFLFEGGKRWPIQKNKSLFCYLR